MYRILLADPHPVARAGYRRFVAATGAGEIVDAPDAACLVDHLALGGGDLLILSVHDRADSAFVATLAHQYPRLRILVVGSQPEEEIALDVLRSGAYGYLPKSATEAETLSVIAKLRAGRRHIGAVTAELVAENAGRPAPPGYSSLSRRERDVFHRLAGGQSTAQIASCLRLDARTVGTYRARVLEKLRLRSNCDITVYAYRRGLSLVSSREAAPGNAHAGIGEAYGVALASRAVAPK